MGRWWTVGILAAWLSAGTMMPAAAGDAPFVPSTDLLPPVAPDAPAPDAAPVCGDDGLGFESLAFYELYEEMITDHLAGRPVPWAWQTAMNAAREVGRRYDPLLHDVERLPLVDDVGANQLVAVWREVVWRNAESPSRSEPASSRGGPLRDAHCAVSTDEPTTMSS